METKETSKGDEAAQTQSTNKHKGQSNKGDSKYSQQNGARSQGHKNGNNNPQKSGRPCREIYRPPSLRSKSNRNSQKDKNRDRESSSSDSNSQLQIANSSSSNVPNNNGTISGGNNVINKGVGNNKSSAVQNGNSGGGMMVSNMGVNSGGSSSATNSPMVNRRNFVTSNNMSQGQRGLNFNANAKEFQQLAANQQQLQTQQIAALLSQLDPNFYSEVMAASSNLYSLQQSKSLNNNLNLLQQQQLCHTNNFGPPFGNYSPFGPYPNSSPGSGGGFFPIGTKSQNASAIDIIPPFNRLTQSKSSGSIPNTGTTVEKARVHFDDTADNELTSNNTLRNAESRFTALNLNGLQRPQEVKKSFGTPSAQLQKSRTGFLLNLYTPQPQGILKHDTVNGQFTKQDKGFTNCVKRSRSFGSTGRSSLTPSINSVYSDFRISKWPKQVQEIVTAAVTAVDRIAARQQIEMVNLIFESMLQYEPPLETPPTNDLLVIRTQDSADSPNWRSNESALAESQETDDNEDDCTDLCSAAVHIFLYFIQKEKDRTIMESLLNTCFASYQKLFSNMSIDCSGKEELGPSKGKNPGTILGTFLKFLSTLYSQVRLLRSQRQQNGGASIDEMSFSLLALLCDSCLALLRSKMSNEPILMGILFTLMTSLGRDMESTFPLKMKQLLAAVRDTLLGLGPYCKGPLCPSVQKTLMQLIELHAANWALPASAVRYYYSNNAVTKSSHNHQKSNGRVEAVL